VASARSPRSSSPRINEAIGLGRPAFPAVASPAHVVAEVPISRPRGRLHGGELAKSRGDRTGAGEGGGLTDHAGCERPSYNPALRVVARHGQQE